MNMIRLTEENLTGEKLSHMTHTEDLLLSGASHSILAIDTLKKVYNTLKGHTEASDIKVTVKVDGAPSFICATDYYGQCFVATKGALSSKKEDKPIARTLEDCHRIWADKPELCYKMSLLLKYAPLLNIPKDEFWQGDFLFSKEDLKVLEFDDEKYITYHPNTLTYAIPVKDPLALKVTRADIGVCWHTRYSGETQKISFDASVKELRNIPAVFQIDVNLPSIAGSVSMTEDESDNIESAINSIETSINQILQDPRYSQLITYNEDSYDFVALLNTYRNSRIRLGSEECTYEDFLNWVISKAQKKIDTLKTEKGKHKNTFKLNSFIAFASTMSDLVERIWDTQALIVEVKEFFIKKLESLTSIRSFVNYVDRGYLPVPGEGFAISDINGNVQKFVSRLGFSKNNFSQETVKGWMTDARAKQELREYKTVKNVDRRDLENRAYTVQDLLSFNKLSEVEYSLLSDLQILQQHYSFLKGIDLNKVRVYGNNAKSNKLHLIVADGHQSREQRIRLYEQLEDLVKFIANNSAKFENLLQLTYLDAIRSSNADGSSKADYLNIVIKQNNNNNQIIKLILATNSEHRPSRKTAAMFLKNIEKNSNIDMSDSKWLRLDKASLASFKKAILQNAINSKELDLSERELRTIEYLLDDNVTNFDLSKSNLRDNIDCLYGADLEDLMKSFGEIWVPVVLLEGKSINNTKLNIEENYGEIVAVRWPVSSSYPFIDSQILYENGCIFIQNKSSKGAHGASVTSYMNQGKMNLEAIDIFCRDLDENAVKNSLIYKIAEYFKMYKDVLSSTYNVPVAVIYWLVGAEITGCNKSVDVTVDDIVECYSVLVKNSTGELCDEKTESTLQKLKDALYYNTSNYVKGLQGSAEIVDYVKGKVNTYGSRQDDVARYAFLTGTYINLLAKILNDARADQTSKDIVVRCIQSDEVLASCYTCKVLNSSKTVNVDFLKVANNSNILFDATSASCFTALNHMKAKAKNLCIDIIS